MKIDYKTLMVFRAMAAAYDGRIHHAQALLQMIYQFESHMIVVLFILTVYQFLELIRRVMDSIVLNFLLKS